MMKVNKIALVGFRLSCGGGERVMANLSRFFHDKGLEVHVIIFHDALGYPYSGSIYNLGKLKSSRNSIFNKIKRFYHFNKYLKQHNFDFIIDFRFRVNIIQEFFISKMIYGFKGIYTVHSSTLNEYMPKNPLLVKLIYGNSYKVVTITNQMKQLVQAKYKLNNLARIYNPVDVKGIVSRREDSIHLDFEFVVSAGHFDTAQKQFDKLIQIYAESILPSANIALVILGDGLKKNELVKEAENYGVSHLVHFLGFKDNPYKYFSNAKCFLLTSLYEGMPMVVLESLACGTPVIAFDCPTGPREIIQHKKNGLLIENQDIEEFVSGLNLFLTNQELYNTCKANSEQSITHFSVDVIGQQWLDLMKYN